MDRKLSTTQWRAIKRLASGEEIWTISGGEARAFWRDSPDERAAGFPTLRVLKRHGLVEDYERNISGAKYRLTPAGRAALTHEQSDEG